MLCSLFTNVRSTMKDCSVGSTGHITSINMNPSAPISGQFVNITIDYTLDTTVSDGQAMYAASLNGFPLTPTTEPLCPDLEKTTTPCPINSGPVNFESTVQIGDGTIHGTISVTTTWRDQNNNQILCWGFTVRV